MHLSSALRLQLNMGARGRLFKSWHALAVVTSVIELCVEQDRADDWITFVVTALVRTTDAIFGLLVKVQHRVIVRRAHVAGTHRLGNETRVVVRHRLTIAFQRALCIVVKREVRIFRVLTAVFKVSIVPARVRSAVAALLLVVILRKERTNMYDRD